MNIKSQLKQMPGLLAIYRFVFRRSPQSTNPYDELSSKSNDELLSLMRHESHRSEKSVHNQILESKHSIYSQKWQTLAVIYQILKERDYPDDEPTIVWSKKIYDTFSNLEEDFIIKNSLPAQVFNPTSAQPFLEFLRSRRRVRVWADEQPEGQILREIAYSMIDEEHCINAPLLIFVGMNTRVYGAPGREERGFFINSGAAIMQMGLLAHQCGLGVCWNYFADNLINLQEINKKYMKILPIKMGMAD